MGALTDKIRGKAKQLAGKLTGDNVLSAQGTAQQAKGDVERAASSVARKLKHTVRAVANRVNAERVRSGRRTRGR
jgi:uncharacterized protein YjbJ (UPF0337 family)